MLPPFLLPVTIGGRPKEFVAQDLPVWAFYWGFNPERITDEWLVGLLTRAVIRPVLTPEIIARLGDGFAEPALAYLVAVGHLDADDARRCGESDWSIGRAAGVGDLMLGELAEVHPPATLRPHTPLDAIRGPEHEETAKLIVSIADRVHVPPHVIWQGWAISDFYLNSRMLQVASPPPLGGF